MKAILVVEFNKSHMCDQKTVDEQYDGSWLKLMKFLYAQEGIGIFVKQPKLIKVEE